MPDLRIVFAGSPQFAAHVLDALIQAGHVPVAVYTQPDRAAGRGRKVQPNPVKRLANAHTLPVEQPQNFRNPEDIAVLQAYQADLLVVVAYGLLLPPAVLATPKLAPLNVHASLLPRWRGAAPIERAFMAGDEQTGVCIMHMEAGLDTGPVYARKTLTIDPQAGIDALEATICNLGVAALLEVIELFVACAPQIPESVAQSDEGVTYARKLTAADRAIDWQQDADAICRRINALAVRLPVRAQINGKRLQLLAAEVIPTEPDANPGQLLHAGADGIDIAAATATVRVTLVKFEGKAQAINAADASRGHASVLQPGAVVQP